MQFCCMLRLMRLIQLPTFILVFGFSALAEAQTNTNGITREMVVAAEALAGLNFSESKIDMMLPGLKEQLESFEVLHKFPLSNGVPPAISFNPIPVGMKFERERQKFKLSSPGKVKLPVNRDDLAFYS